MKTLTILLSLAAAFALSSIPVLGHEGHDHMADVDATKDAAEITVKGELLDMACYIDHGATGTKHADCARKCITSGLPVGIKGEDGKTYLLIGEHKPMNQGLAELAAKTITVRGKFSSRDGFNLIENAEIQK